MLELDAKGQTVGPGIARLTTVQGGVDGAVVQRRMVGGERRMVQNRRVGNVRLGDRGVVRNRGSHQRGRVSDHRGGGNVRVRHHGRGVMVSQTEVNATLRLHRLHRLIIGVDRSDEHEHSDSLERTKSHTQQSLN